MLKYTCTIEDEIILSKQIKNLLQKFFIVEQVDCKIVVIFQLQIYSFRRKVMGIVDFRV